MINYDKSKIRFNERFDFETITNSIKGLYVADFETSKVSAEMEEVFTYATGFMDVNSNENICYYNNNLEDFIHNISNLPYLESVIYFHNLSYDVVFLLLELCKNQGFTQIRNKYKERKDGGLQFISGKKKIDIKVEQAKAKKDDEEIYCIRPYSYNVVYNNGSFYKLDLYFDYETFKGANGRKQTKIRKVTLKDSYKLASFPLKTIAKNFLDYEMPKDAIDHNIIRPKDYILTDEELPYLYDDIIVLKEFIKLTVLEGIDVKEGYRVHFKNLTIASQSMNEYKELMYEHYVNDDFYNIKAFKESFESLLNYNIYLKQQGRKEIKIDKDKLFETVFPKLHPNIDCFLRQSYYGGITYKNSDLINHLEGQELKGIVYDVNSLYPSVMRTKLLPYGKPKFFTGKYDLQPVGIKEEYPLYIQQVKVPLFKIKPNKMPNVQIRESIRFKSTDYQKDNSYIDKFGNKQYEECIFTFTNVQLERFLDTYDIPMGIEYLDGYMFKGSYGLFDNYIDTFMELKKSGTGAVRATAKLFLNSLYGKFGTNPCREERLINFEDDLFSTTNRNENGEYLEYLTDCVYLTVASFITSYAREVLLTAVNNVWDRFLYCDTDSIHILGTEEPQIPIHDKELGHWKFEGEFVNAKYIGAKRYAELIKTENGTHWDIKCCGVSGDIIKDLDDIEVFTPCEYTSKELTKLIDTFYKKDDIYYYKDKECTEKVKGLVRSKKKKYVKGGILIKEQPYAITENMFSLYRN